MAICRCMILAFTEGWENDSYDASDLREGIEYALDQLRDRRRRYDKMYRYDLRKFVAWARWKLRKISDPENKTNCV